MKVRINTVGELKKLLNNIDDDFLIDVDIIKDEFMSSFQGILEYNDTDYSSKVICFGVYESRDD